MSAFLGASLIDLEATASLFEALPVPPQLAGMLRDLKPRGRVADARLECANGLADRRRRHGQLCGGLAEAAMLRHRERGFHPVERALADCEVWLHGASTLSRIVAGGKRPYIGQAGRDREFRQ